MLPWSRADSSGVAPPDPGSSRGSDFFPLYRSDPSSSRAIVVPISSTWLISSVPMPWSRSRYGLALGPRKLMLWNRYCIIVRISPNWPPSPSCRALAAAGSGSSAAMSLMSRCTCRYMSSPSSGVLVLGVRGTARLAQGAAEPHVLLLLGLLLLARARVPRRELDGLLGLDAALQLASALDLGVELRSEQQREVGDPQPEQEHDDPGQRAVGLVVAGEVADVEPERERREHPHDEGDDRAQAD